tara:strand:+ start:679 stop:1254 length:576 start_codon:yes stop_codon:yes gene_type:complete
MIYFIDDFLEKDLFKGITEKLNNDEYVEHKTPGKSFWVQESSNDFNSYVLQKLEEIEGNKLENILGFFRISNDVVDTNWRIHSDLNIQGEQPDRALVLYMSPREINELHGTALWRHKVYGKSLPKQTTNEEFDRMIVKEAENLDMWTIDSIIGYEENRAISYPAHYFHSKYPNKSWKKGRQVFVMFYKIKQ